MKPEVKALAITLGIVGVLCLLGIPLAIIAANRPKREPTPLATEGVTGRKTDTNYSWKPFPSGNTYEGWDSKHYGRMLKDSDELTFYHGIEGCRIIGDRHAVWCLAEALMREKKTSKWIASITDAIRQQGSTSKDALPALRHTLERLGPGHKDAQRIADAIKKIEDS